MKTFNPGDRVRRINYPNTTPSETMAVGSEWTVIEQDGAWLAVEGIFGDRPVSDPQHFELVSEAREFSVGQKVHYSDEKCSGVGTVVSYTDDKSIFDYFVEVEPKDVRFAYFDGHTSRMFAEGDLTAFVEEAPESLSGSNADVIIPDEIDEEEAAALSEILSFLMGEGLVEEAFEDEETPAPVVINIDVNVTIYA